MTLILHLSDLHLGQNDDIGDYKSKIVPAKERATRRGILQATLGAINRHLRAALIGMPTSSSLCDRLGTRPP
jgi:hypothetical protein